MASWAWGTDPWAWGTAPWTRDMDPWTRARALSPGSGS